MEKYSGGWSHIEIGVLSNKFYMQHEPREVLSVNRSFNFWGCSVTGVNYSTYGFVYYRQRRLYHGLHRGRRCDKERQA